MGQNRKRNATHSFLKTDLTRGCSMRGVFDDERLEPAQPGQDTELTLGSGTLLLIFFGLVALCGLCFGTGYAVGRRSVPLIASAAQPPLPPSGSLSKPSATTPPVPATDVPAAPVDAGVPSATATSAPNSAPVANPGASPAAVAPSLPAALSNPPNLPVQPQVRPAFPVASTAPPSTQPVAQPVAQSVQPALSPPALLMVQIAAVSKVEDAATLVNALRKRGYAVTARREPADNLIHVRIGPFTTREEALRWQQKLLNDGYNAIIQP
jgi:DedD protein